MAVIATVNPLNQFFALNGAPLNNGKLYFGDINADPEQNPVQMYWDAAGLVPALQPIRTTSGYPSRSGSPAILYCASEYSLRVLQSNDVQVFYLPRAGSPALQTLAQWEATGVTPLYASADSFTLTGDQTEEFEVGRRARFTVTAGFVYGTILTSVYGALTTVTMTMDDAQVLDAGLTAVDLSILTASNSAVPGILNSTIFTGNPTAPQAADGDADLSIANTAYVQSAYAAVRQTVLSGPVDTNGFAAFGGATGAATVTASGTLIVTAANGVFNRRGSITNPAWTGLSTNGTMYLWLDIAQGGVCTTGSGTLVPTYRSGGADVVTANQFTFNIQEMQGKVGNGTTAAQTYRVYVGEVTVAGAVVTAITWYQPLGRYSSVQTAIRTAAGADTFNHNLGVMPRSKKWVLVNVITELNWAVGDEHENPVMYSAGADILSLSPITNRLTAVHVASASIAANMRLYNKTTFGVATSITGANWRYRVDLDRGW